MEASTQLAALEVVLSHPVLAADPLLLCSAARVCSTWRTAVSAAGAGSMEVNIKDAERGKEALLIQMCSFTAWLVRHVQAVRSISVDICLDGRDKPVALLCHILTQALQLAAASGKLRLQCFSINDTTPALLHALPSTLTDVSVCVGGGHGAATEALTAALERLKQLRALSVNVYESPLPLGPLRGLSHLTSLVLWGSVDQDNWTTMCEALDQLPGLEVLRLNLSTEAQPAEELQLTHLTKLTQLDVGLGDDSPPGNLMLQMMMPPQVQHLSLRLQGLSAYNSPWSDLPSLKDLRHFVLCCGEEALARTPGALAVLRRVTQLDALELEYCSLSAAAADASHWGSLPHVVGIKAIESAVSSYMDLAQVLFHMSVLTGLTRLELELLTDDEDDEDDEPFQACSHLSGLTALQVLHMHSYATMVLEPRDCLHLSPLQHLTSLELYGMKAAVDDMVAVALACSMPLLRDLDLRQCALTTDAAIPALARLQHLTRLRLSGTPASERAQAMLMEARARLQAAPLTLV